MSAAVAAASAAANANRRNSTTTAKKTNYTPNQYYHLSSSPSVSLSSPCKNLYEIYKFQDWNKFVHYIKNIYQPPSSVLQCNGSHVLGFLNHLDQFGETKVHSMSCEYYGQAAAVACSCPRKEAWTSLEGVVRRLRVAFEECGGSPKTNPFGSPLVWLYLKEVKLSQTKNIK